MLMLATVLLVNLTSPHDTGDWFAIMQDSACHRTTLTPDSFATRLGDDWLNTRSFRDERNQLADVVIEAKGNRSWLFFSSRQVCEIALKRGKQLGIWPNNNMW